MNLSEIYAEAKTWQQGIGALMGFIGLMIAALWNFRLNRRRDLALREEEMKSVAAALYGEIRVVRERVAVVARAVARLHIAHGLNGMHPIKFDTHFVDANRLPELTLYKALAPKFGLLPSDLLISIAAFYENVFQVGAWLPRLADDPTRGYSYGPLYVLKPARDAVVGVSPTLAKIESMIGVRNGVDAAPEEMNDVLSTIDIEEERYRQMAESN